MKTNKGTKQDKHTPQLHGDPVTVEFVHLSPVARMCVSVLDLLSEVGMIWCTRSTSWLHTSALSY